MGSDRAHAPGEWHLLAAPACHTQHGGPQRTRELPLARLVTALFCWTHRFAASGSHGFHKGGNDVTVVV